MVHRFRLALAWSLALVPALALCLLAAACGSGGGGGRVLVIGLDGMDPRAVDLLMSEGKMPAFAKMRQEGAYGILHSMKPLLSPVVWTTIATGKTPDKHKIGHFTAVNQVTGEQLPVTSQMRKVKALWNIASEKDRTVSIIGYWATWPAEPVNGTIVSDHTCYHFLFQDGFDKNAPDPGGKTWPPDLIKEIAPMIIRPGDLTMADTKDFIDVTPEEFNRPFSFQDDLSHFKWALATARSYLKIGLHLWDEKRPDLEMVYIEGTDSTSHLFGHLFRAQGLAGELADQQRHYGHAVEQMYIEADRIVGKFLKAADDRTTVIVVSDHGFDLGELNDDPSRTRDMRRVSEKFHSPNGILYMYGNHVKTYTRVEDASILDITPTILTLLGLPAASDMPGRVLSQALDIDAPIRIPTYETGEKHDVQVAEDTAVDSQILEKLKSLGYLDASSPTGDRNLAAVLFEEGKYEKAVEAYRKLVAADPNDGGLRTSLAGALGALGKYDEALEQLEAAIKLQPLNPEAYHNRAVIHERKGDVDAAIADYRTALKYNPQYEPSRQALQRLGAPMKSPEAPRTPEQEKAFALAEEAGSLARRGDYKTAMARLDEAEKVAPKFALVYQYRSNVAYLMGDKEAAVAALKKGLELDPGNALFRENLKRLQETSSR